MLITVSPAGASMGRTFCGCGWTPPTGCWADGRLPIAEMTTRCGFSHQEHLTRVVTARLGATPAAIGRGEIPG